MSPESELMLKVAANIHAYERFAACVCSALNAQAVDSPLRAEIGRLVKKLNVDLET